MKVKVVPDEILAKNQVKIHAVDRLGIGYTSVFAVYGGELVELRDKRRASNGSRFWPDPVTSAMLKAASDHLLCKRPVS